MRILIEAGNGAVSVEDGLIVEQGGRWDIVITQPTAILLPGLINAHDHLHRNHYGRLGNPPYRSAHDWGPDIQLRSSTAIREGRALPKRDALLEGAWKNLFSGVTTVVHHDRWEEEFTRRFPLRVVPVRWAHSVLTGPEPPQPGSECAPFTMHLAEGTDDGAADEVRRAYSMGLLNEDLLAVHAVGVDTDGIRRIRASGAGVVCCPSSNFFLLGRTAPPELLAPGIDVLIGSDSLLSAAGDLLDEIRIARATGLISDERLRAAVGAVAARRLGLHEWPRLPGDRADSAPDPSGPWSRPPPVLSALATGDATRRADLVLLRRDLLEASAEDVLLVMAGGVIRVLSPELLPALKDHASRGERMSRRGVVRWVDQRSTAPLMMRSALRL